MDDEFLAYDNVSAFQIEPGDIIMEDERIIIVDSVTDEKDTITVECNDLDGEPVSIQYQSDERVNLYLSTYSQIEV